MEIVFLALNIDTEVRNAPIYPVWRRPRGRQQLSWLEQVDESCQELLRMGRGPAWRLAPRDPRVWRRRVGDATRLPAYAPFDWLIDWYSSYFVLKSFYYIFNVFFYIIMLKKLIFSSKDGHCGPERVNLSFGH